MKVQVITNANAYAALERLLEHTMNKVYSTPNLRSEIGLSNLDVYEISTIRRQLKKGFAASQKKIRISKHKKK